MTLRREISTDVRAHRLTSVADFFKHPEGLASVITGMALAQVSMVLPDQRSINNAFTEHNGMLYGRVRRNAPAPTESEISAVLNSAIYSKLNATTSFNGARYHIMPNEFIQLFLWGGDEFFSTFDINYAGEHNEPTFTFNNERLYALLASDWRHDKPVDLAETALVLAPYWWSRSDTLLSIRELDMPLWAGVVANGTLREVIARRQHFGKSNYHRNDAMRTVLYRFSNGSYLDNGDPLGWFVLGQIPFSYQYTDDDHEGYIAALVQLQKLRHLDEIAPYIAAGIEPSAVNMIIDNEVDIDLALAAQN